MKGECAFAPMPEGKWIIRTLFSMNATKRLHALIDNEVPIALAYPKPKSGITPLHFFKSDVSNDPGWYKFSSEEDKRHYDELNGKIKLLTFDLIDKEKAGTLTNDNVDELEKLMREREQIKTVKC